MGEETLASLFPEEGEDSAREEARRLKLLTARPLGRAAELEFDMSAAF